MKKLLKKILIYAAIIFAAVMLLLLTFDNVYMPWVVNEDEVTVPSVIGLTKEQAIIKLKDANLNPIEEEPRVNDKVEKGIVFFQKPVSGAVVKENRRVYFCISGGEKLVKMPVLEGKTLRDAKITIERYELKLGKVIEVESEYPENTVIGQSLKEGRNVAQGEEVDIEISIGPKLGQIRVPQVVGRSLTEAEKIIRNNSLVPGEITYVNSPALLPNTIVIQYPAEGKLVAIGDSVSLVVAKD
ncbi:MAG: PASTA domain-containing protein [Ignavibacteria bacterium]|nr:PASTA domain-containing protein [Ignavibacteria bacterium]